MEHFNPILGHETTGPKFITCGEIDTTHLTGTNVPDDLSRPMRASYYFLGAL